MGGPGGLESGAKPETLTSSGLLRQSMTGYCCGMSESSVTHDPSRDLAIAAVIPLFNGASFIEEALNSVLSQTLRPSQIIVVDDGSTDHGPDIVSRMAEAHDIVLLRKPNGGQASARNFGIRHARTPLIALLDQDDIWYPNHLKELVTPFRTPRYPELGWVYSNLDEIDREGSMVTRFCLDLVPNVEHPKRSLASCLVADMFILPTSCLISRAAFDDVGGFDERLIGYEDDDLFLRMFRKGYDNVYINKSLAKWRIYSDSSSFSPSMGRSRMVYFRKLVETFPYDGRRNADYISQLIAPRFCPALMLEFRHARASGDPALIAGALDDLRFLADHLPGRARRIMRSSLPALSWGPTAGLAESWITFNLKLINLRLFKTIARRLLGLPRAGSHGQRPNEG